MANHALIYLYRNYKETFLKKKFPCFQEWNTFMNSEYLLGLKAATWNNAKVSVEYRVFYPLLSGNIIPVIKTSVILSSYFKSVF